MPTGRVPGPRVGGARAPGQMDGVRAPGWVETRAPGRMGGPGPRVDRARGPVLRHSGLGS